MHIQMALDMISDQFALKATKEIGIHRMITVKGNGSKTKKAKTLCN